MADYYLIAEQRGSNEDEVTRVSTPGMDESQMTTLRAVAISDGRAHALATGKRTYVYGPTDEGVAQTADDRVWDSATDL